MLYLFCNIGWMEYYQGDLSSDSISGGSSYVKENKEGFEIYNFASHNGYMYGFVQRPWKRNSDKLVSIRLERILNDETKEYVPKIDNVFVIWTAPRPRIGSVVVGWYRNATVFRENQCLDFTHPLYDENEPIGYRTKVKSADAELLPINERIIPILGNKLHSNIWYGDDPDDPYGKRLAKKVFAVAKEKVRERKQKLKSKQDKAQ